MRTHCTVLALTALASPALAGIAYTFDSDAQGWSIANDGTGFMWDGTIGNGVGAIRARDVVSGNIWLFSAPDADLGPMGGMYNTSISYEILGITGSHTNLGGGERADIILQGAGISIGINAGTQPVNDQWTSASALVSVDADWKILSSFSDATLTGSLATQGQIESVLADMTGLFIRGEYTNGGDATAIDNVDFVPAPSAMALLGLGGLATTRRRR